MGKMMGKVEEGKGKGKTRNYKIGEEKIGLPGV